MNLNPTPRAASAKSSNTEHLDTEHLDTEQLGELLDGSADTPVAAAAQMHLRGCTACAAEFASLQEALALFRESTTAYANDTLAGIDRPALRTAPARHSWSLSTSPGLMWAAAGLVALAALLPLEAHRHHGPAPHVAAASSTAPAGSESDEALLEDINREVSAQVPDSMQPLADPADSSSSTSSTSTTSTRKN